MTSAHRLATTTVLMLALGACSSPEDNAALLPAGTKVMLRTQDGSAVQGWLVSGGKVSAEHVNVTSGSPAEVVEDHGVKPPLEPSLRFVRVRLLDGARAGSEVGIARYKVLRQDR